MYFRNFQRLKPDSRAMPPSTSTTNRKQVMYIVPISLPSETIEPRPYLPTVNAIAPNAASGASRMIMPTTENTPCVNESRKSTTGLARGADVRQRDAEHRREDQDLQDVVLGQRVDDAGRHQVQHEVDEAGRLGGRRGVGGDRLGVELGGVDVHAVAGRTTLTTTRPSASAKVDSTSK